LSVGQYPPFAPVFGGKSPADGMRMLADVVRSISQAYGSLHVNSCKGIEQCTGLGLSQLRQLLRCQRAATPLANKRYLARAPALWARQSRVETRLRGLRLARAATSCSAKFIQTNAAAKAAFYLNAADCPDLGRTRILSDRPAGSAPVGRFCICATRR
jgi:hypothetical protein